MKAAVRDLWHVLTGAGIALDKKEAEALGAPAGETISLWCAIESRHGCLIAHIACLGLYLVQFRHCRDQLAGVPMHPGNYVRAAILLVLIAPPVFTVGVCRRLLKCL